MKNTTTKKSDTQTVKEAIETLAKDWKQETQEQYSKGTFPTKLMKQIIPLAMTQPTGELMRKLTTIWESSRMAKKTLVVLALELIADDIQGDDDELLQDQINELQAELEQRRADREEAEEQPKAEDYKFIAMWGRLMGSFTYYIENEQAEAVKDKAPLNAIYKHYREGWKTADSVTNEETRKQLGLDEATPNTPHEVEHSNPETSTDDNDIDIDDIINAPMEAHNIDIIREALEQYKTAPKVEPLPLREAEHKENGQYNSGLLGFVGEEKKELWKHSDFAEVQQLKKCDDEKHMENGFRAYCSHWGNTKGENAFNLQVRTHKGLGSFGGGVPRDMLASVTLSLNELRQLLAWAEQYKI